MPAVGEHLTAKFYVHQAICNSVDEPPLIINIQDNSFNDFSLTNINITSNTEAIHDNQVFMKPYVDHFHQENERSRRKLGMELYYESSGSLEINQDKILTIKI